MRRDWVQFGLIGLLLILLGTLAFLQYRWQGQISDAEKVRLEKRVVDDANRFTFDFDSQLQNAVFYQDASEKGLFDQNGIRFIKRHLEWKSKSGPDGLFRSVYRVGQEETLKLDEQNRSFVVAELPLDAGGVLEKIKKTPMNLTRSGDFLVVPVFEEHESVSELVVTSSDDFKTIDREQVLGSSKVIGHLVLELDRKVLSEKVLRPLYEKYFANRDGVGFDVAVYEADNSLVWASVESGFKESDFTTQFFSFRPRDFVFFPGTRNNLERKERQKGLLKQKKNRVIVSETFSSKVFTDDNKGKIDISVAPVGSRSGRNVTVFTKSISNQLWTLKVRHESGSLPIFVANTRNRNLLVSFGILSVLAIGMIAIFVTARRARILAQRQVDFVSSVSHEFRTPLAVIYSASENITDGVVEEPKKLREYGGLIKREGNKLSSMVEQILQYAGASARNQHTTRESFDIGDVLREVIEEYSPLFEEQNFRFESDFDSGDLKVTGDRNSILQAVRNLVTNAMKYSNGTRWIRISAQRNRNEVAIAVDDKGIGISSAEKKNIFEPFYRAKEVVDEQISGNGLGLSLVKRIVDEHGGRVEVSSEPGKGSTFQIILPTAGV